MTERPAAAPDLRDVLAAARLGRVRRIRATRGQRRQLGRDGELALHLLGARDAAGRRDRRFPLTEQAVHRLAIRLGGRGGQKRARGTESAGPHKRSF